LNLPTLTFEEFGIMPHRTEDTPQTRVDKTRLTATVLSSARPVTDWPELDPSLLEDGRPVLPSFPFDVLPQPWREWVADAASGADAPSDYVVQALLAAVAGLAGSGVRVWVKQTWSEPLVLWQALVGAASTGKTPALETVGRPLATVEKLLQRNASGAEGPAQDQRACPEQGRRACPEQGRRVVVDNAAPAALLRSVKARPAGVLLWRDEAGDWLKSLAPETRDDEPYGRLIDAWSARGNLAVSIVGSLHPDRLPTALQAAGGGLVARFLFAWPGRVAGHPPGEDKPSREDEAVTMLHRIAGVVGSPERPLALAFDEPARKSLDVGLAQMAEASQGAEGLEMAWLGKGKGTVVRLAAVLALLEWSRNPNPPRPPDTVSSDQVVSATRLWQGYFLPHARAVLDRGAPSDLERQARRVARWLKAGGEKRANVTRQEVRIQALGKTVTADRTDGVLGRLWAMGYVRPAARTSLPQGGRPSQRWEVNPALATT
jgi:hypothetical protein